MSRAPSSLLCRLLPFAAAALLFGAPAVAQAQDREPGSVRFARALSDRGWYDLAGIVLDDLSKDSSTPKATLEKLKFLRADMAIHEATSAPTADERKKKIEAARAFYENFAKENPDKPEGVEARMRVGEIYLQVGDAAMGRLRDPASTDADERTKDRAEAQECFTKGAKYFGELKTVYNDLVDKAGELPPDATAEDNAAAEEKIADAVYKVSLAALNEAKAIYKNSQTYDAGKEHDELLEKALKQLQQVGTEYADVPDTAAEANMLLGLAEKDQGKLDEAVAAFDGAASLIKTIVPEGKKLTDPYYGDILGRALYLRTQANCDKADWPKALESVKEFLVYFPDNDKKGDQLAQFLRIEEARAKNGAGDQKGAVKILDALLAAPATPAVAYNANKWKNELMGKGGSASADLSPDKALQAADAMLDGGKKPQGLNRLRQLIAELEAAGKDGEAMLPAVWYRLARAYFEENRFDEAVVCFDLVASRYKSDPNAPKAVFYSATCAGRMQGALANDFDKQRNVKALETLQKDHPKAPETKAGSFLLGNIKLGNKEYVAAATEYDKVPQDAGEFYEAAIYQSAVVWMLEARARVAKKDENGAKEAYAKAVTSFQKTITWGDGAAGRGVDPASDRMNNVRKVQAESWLRIADIRLTPLMKDPAKALEAAQASEKALGANGTPERVGEARYYGVQAHLAKPDLVAAEAALSDLVSVAPELKRTSDAERDVAAALDQQVQELLKAKDKKAELDSTMARAADHYSRWLAIATKNQYPVSMLQASRAGDRLFLLAVLLNGLPEGTFGYTEVADLKTLPAANRFEQAAKAFEFAARQIPAAEAVDPKAPKPPVKPPTPPKPGAPVDNEPWLILVKLGQCMGFLQRFDACVAAIDRALEMERLVDDKGNIVTAVAKVRTPLLYAFADAAQAARLQGDKSGGKDKAFYERAIAGFQKLIVVCPVDGDLWWRSKYEFILALYLKGDYTSAGVGVRSLKRQYPDFDQGRFGFKTKFEALAADVEKKNP